MSGGPTRKVFRELAAIVGPDRALHEPADMLAFASDARVEASRPALVLYPVSDEEVSAILRTCSRQGLPIVPRGAATGTIGGAIPELPGAVVLSLERMDRIIEINQEDSYAVVEPGVVVKRFKDEVSGRGLFYPPDPASADTSTLGGNVATNAGGLRAIKYGVTRDYVLGLRAVLASGDVIDAGVRTRKGVMGYDLVRLLCGSEGTLAVITRLTLRLIARPEAVRTLSAWFASTEAAGEAVVAVCQGRVLPAALELMDRASLEAVGSDVPAGCEAMLLCDVDGPGDRVDNEIEVLASTMREHGSLDVSIAKDANEAERLWSGRRSISPALYKIRPRKLAEDVTVPISKVPELLRRASAAATARGVLNVNYGHAGDGNIHVNVLFDPKKPGEREAAEEIVQDVFKITLDLGGTLSGEHGVGLAKREALRLELDPAQIELSRRIKAAFDPQGILNPGKVLPPRR